MKTFQLLEAVRETYKADLENPAHEPTRLAMVCFDMLSRIFGLLDVTTNPSNFGTSQVVGNPRKWKILDFKVPDRPDFYKNLRIVEGFKEGNGLFNYDYAAFMHDIFKNPGKFDRRISLARQAPQTLHEGGPCLTRETRKMPLLAAAGQGFDEISSYFSANCAALEVDRESALLDLKANYQAVQANFWALADGAATLSGDTLSVTGVATVK